MALETTVENGGALAAICAGYLPTKVMTVEIGVAPGGEYLGYPHPRDPRCVDSGTSVVSYAPLSSLVNLFGM